MKKTLLAGACALPLALGLVGSAAADPPPMGAIECDRACLQSAVDQTLAAMVAHDAKRLPLAADIRYTENGQELQLNDGFWGTAAGLGVYKHYFLDPRTDQAGFFGVVKENSSQALIAMRLKLNGKKITEIETIIARSGLGTAGPAAAGAANLEAMGKPDAIWLQDNPDHASREDVIRVSNKYFSGLENNDGKGDYSFFADDCYRLENGSQTTSGPHPAPPRPPPPPGSPPPPPRTGPDLLTLGCKQGFETGFFKVVTRIRDRRFPIVDEEKGVGFAFGFFDHSAQVQEFKLSDGTVRRGGLQAPFTWEIAEAFRIEKGKIKVVEAVLTNAPYGMKAGWDGH